MIDVLLRINGRDFSARLSSYSLEQEITYQDVITTIDGKEHYGKKMKRDILTFSLIPYDEDTAAADYDCLSDSEIFVDYTSPHEVGTTKTGVEMKVVSSLSSAFGLKSINGKRYYRGDEIVLRAVSTE